ncbi:hypothetical protein MKW94_023530 [Papaver nudicaule]|uniref:Uncharacterized protein n=1 Tax=Papaver nudicaule TaxID=74823 RepID=A0AA41V3K3_PAPNU|nr:hypothetical protein [Papaver nudicaule]
MDVDELIKAAQDELLLKLSINSHTTTNNLDLDLLHRFQALKSTKTPSSKTAPGSSSSAKDSLPTPAKKEGSDSGAGLLDLDSRFNALKNKSGSSSAAGIGRLGLGDDGSDGGDEDDEVEKLIRWAKDAARLDPSPPSDDDDAGGDDREDDSDDDDLEDTDDTDDEEEIRKKSKVKGTTKVKGTKKR